MDPTLEAKLLVLCGFTRFRSLTNISKSLFVLFETPNGSNVEISRMDMGLFFGLVLVNNSVDKAPGETGASAILLTLIRASPSFPIDEARLGLLEDDLCAFLRDEVEEVLSSSDLLPLLELMDLSLLLRNCLVSRIPNELDRFGFDVPSPKTLLLDLSLLFDFRPSFSSLDNIRLLSPSFSFCLAFSLSRAPRELCRFLLLVRLRVPEEPSVPTEDLRNAEVFLLDLS